MAQGEPIGEAVRRLRQAALLTQNKLAERAKMSARTISDIESGRQTNPRSDTLHAIGSALGLDAGALAAFVAHAVRPRPAPGLTLQRPVTELVGREPHLGLIAELLRETATQLITITGLPGVGKSAFALEAATRAQKAFSLQGYLDCADLEGATIGEALAQGFGLDHQRLLRALFARERTLLLLDNVDRILGAAREIALFLSAGSRLLVVVTSRHALQLRSERELHLPPLDDAAVQEVLIRRTSASQMKARADDGAAAGIVARLNGLPLAAELAAISLEPMTMRSWLSRYPSTLDALDRAALDAPAHHRSMRAALAWGMDALDENERRAFAAFAPFDAGVTPEALARVLEVDDALPLLGGLVRMNLIVREEVDGANRFVMPSLLQEFACERAVASEHRLADAARHARYFLELAHTWVPQIRSAHTSEALRVLDREQQNLEAALRFFARNGGVRDGFQLCAVLAPYWLVRGDLERASTWISRLVELTTAEADDDGAGLALNLTQAVGVSILLGDFDAADRYLERVFVLLRRLPERDDIRARALFNAGVVAHARGNYALADDSQDRALALLAAGTDRKRYAAALADSGTLLAERDRAREALERHRQALATFDELGDNEGVSATLMAIGIDFTRLGDHQAALEHLSSALADIEKFGLRNYEAAARLGLAAVRRERGDLDGALREHITALRLTETNGNLGDIPDACEDLALTLVRVGAPELAAYAFGQAAEARRRLRYVAQPVQRARIDAVRAALRREYEETIAEGAASSLEEVRRRVESLLATRRRQRRAAARRDAYAVGDSATSEKVGQNL